MGCGQDLRIFFVVFPARKAYCAAEPRVVQHQPRLWGGQKELVFQCDCTAALSARGWVQCKLQRLCAPATSSKLRPRKWAWALGAEALVSSPAPRRSSVRTVAGGKLLRRPTENCSSFMDSAASRKGPASD